MNGWASKEIDKAVTKAAEETKELQAPIRAGRKGIIAGQAKRLSSLALGADEATAMQKALEANDASVADSNKRESERLAQKDLNRKVGFGRLNTTATIDFGADGDDVTEKPESTIQSTDKIMTP
jgi:hypothetical protein